MDSLITAAVHALAKGDVLGAPNWGALRDDAPALALRGIAIAQLGDLVRAKALLRSATRAFGPKEAVARVRCIVAEAEIALARSLPLRRWKQREGESRPPAQARVQSGVKTIDHYRWRNITFNSLLYPDLLHSTPRHSHSIVPGGFEVTS